MGIDILGSMTKTTLGAVAEADSEANPKRSYRRPAVASRIRIKQAELEVVEVDPVSSPWTLAITPGF